MHVRLLRMNAEAVDLSAHRAAMNLRDSLAKGEKGDIHPTVSNIIAILRHDTALRGILTFNEFTYEQLVTRAPPVPDEDAAPLPGPYPRLWEPADVSLIHAYIQRNYIARATAQAVDSAMTAVVRMQSYHPVRDWLSTLQWDGIPRLDKWLSKTFGAAPSPYTSAVGTKTLVAAVRRVKQPGCKFDYMPVFEGLQGIGKSKAMQALFGSDWFSDSIHHDLGHKDAALSLIGHWCVEMAEIDQLIRNEVETIKGFLSRSVDRYRPPFGRSVVARPRQGIMVGTTNQDDYLRDSTGNRRFWPVQCAFVDIDWLTMSRDQLWAEAVVYEAGDINLWLDEDEVQIEATELQSLRLMEDVWEEKIADGLLGRSTVSIPEILENILSIPTKDHDKRGQMRVASILRRQGWLRQLRWGEGKPGRVWTKGG